MQIFVQLKFKAYICIILYITNSVIFRLLAYMNFYKENN